MMKRLLWCFFLLAVTCHRAIAEVEWTTDYVGALARAAHENKTVLLDFTGSDWCGWCMKLKKEVFDQPEFAAYAHANLIMVEVDFPRHKELSAHQTAANEQLSADYNIRGYPTIILTDSKGKQIGNAGYMPGGPQKFISMLEAIPGMAHHPAAEVAQVAAPAEAPHRPPEFVPIPPAVPLKYGDMTLKGLSGVKGHRLALINNATLMTGESGKVKVHDERVDVTVKEIRDDSVLVVVDGSTRELKLAQH